VAGPSSPTVKRRRLAAELRAMREQAAMTIEAVARQLEWSTAKISRIENARTSVMPRDVKYLLRVYGIPEGSEVFQTLTTLARESRQKGWWQSFGDAVPEEFSTYVGLEASVSSLRTYEAEYIPGLLQTEDYARAVIRASMLTAPAESVDQHVAVRMARQERLGSDDAPALWAVLNEAVIRRVVGGVPVMREQLGRLLEAAESPAVTLQVLPFTAGAHPGMDGAFMILQFPGDPDVVYIHYHTGTIYLEKGADTGAYSLMFDHLRAAALAPDASRALITRVQDELG
jgi:transcriptional regulator with XRE-family HTH domain